MENKLSKILSILKLQDTEKERDATAPNPYMEKTTVEKLEKRYTLKDARLGDEPVVFGFLNKQWTNMKEKIQKDDELYYFRSDANSWGNLAGREGVALVRDGEIIDEVIVRMN
ncbi:MAG: hypothetical protein U9N33_07880 [Campylobacterota bacterium]|nr:hypothetical protein [Campylobacterota bacterium]